MGAAATVVWQSEHRHSQRCPAFRRRGRVRCAGERNLARPETWQLRLGRRDRRRRRHRRDACHQAILEAGEGPGSGRGHGVDILIDGLVLGIGFAAGARQGLLLTIALTIEVLFLGLTLATEFAEAWKTRWKVIALIAAIGLALPFGALAGAPVASLPPAILTGFYAFGLIALLYLVTEELLVEAHKRPDTPLIASMFFVGFSAPALCSKRSFRDRLETTPTPTSALSRWRLSPTSPGPRHLEGKHPERTRVQLRRRGGDDVAAHAEPSARPTIAAVAHDRGTRR